MAVVLWQLLGVDA
ncbi:unnamed protein product [Calypogeia fissa]